jgi:hypothetical protein
MHCILLLYSAKVVRYDSVIIHGVSRIQSRFSILTVGRYRRSFMGVFNLFSKRQRQARGEMPDVYVFDKLPPALRVQIVHIIQDAFGVDHYNHYYVANTYEFVKQTLCRE